MNGIVIGVAAACRQVGGLDEAELSVWIARRWVAPLAGPEPGFRAADLARIRLIAELRHDLRIDEEALELVLSLLDQLHGERARLRRLSAALARHASPELLDLLEAAMREG